MCAHLFYIPQKFGGPTRIRWQRQELTQVALGRARGAAQEQSLAPFSRFLLSHGEEGVRRRLLHTLWPSSLWGQTVVHQGHAGIPWLISLYNSAK